MLKNLINQRFGRLIVLSQENSKNGKRYWRCLCDCGNTVVTYTSNLTTGNVKSCGCLIKENAIKQIKGQKKKKVDLTGQKFGRLLAQERIDEEHKGKTVAFYKCLCDCGKIVKVRGYSLKRGNTRSCGCLAKEVQIQTGKNSKGRKSKKFIDLTGQRFGRLLVKERVFSENSQQVKWRCLCDCGKETFPTTSHLRSGHTKSCGCLGLENATKAKITHNSSGSRLLTIFRAMHNRCTNKNRYSYKWYGGKGVRVCEEWSDFINFKNWALSNGYQENLTIDRIDPNKNYEPTNCRWITQSENSKRVVHKKKEL